MNKTPLDSSLQALLQRSGEVQPLASNLTLDLHAPGMVWWVLEGRVDVFLQGDDGARASFASINSGHLLIGHAAVEDGGARFLATGLPGTRIIHIQWDTLLQIAQDAGHEDILISWVEQWVLSWSEGVTQRVKPRPEVHLQMVLNSGPVQVPARHRLRSTRGVLWLHDPSAQGYYIGLEPMPESGLPVELTPLSWVEFGAPATVTASDTASLLARGVLGPCLQAFGRMVLACEALNVSLANVDEYNRLRYQKEREAQQAHESLSGLVRALQGQAPAPVGNPYPHGPGAKVWQMFQAVATASGVKLTPPSYPSPEHALADPQPLRQILQSSQLRWRTVRLDGQWWKRSLGPLMAWRISDSAPVALLPKGHGRYMAWWPEESQPRPLDGEQAATLGNDATMLYPCFDPAPVKGWQLLRLGLRASQTDFFAMVASIVFLGVLAWLTPYLMGLLLSRVLPSGDAMWLSDLRQAMLVSLFGVATAKLAQRAALLNIESRFDVNTGAALIDRVLRLPPAFFRQYSSGDLGTRLLSLQAIRQTCSAILVNTLLPATSGLLALVMLWFLSPVLALIATVISVLVLGLLALIAWPHLERQRQVHKLQGQLSGMLLEVLGNIVKLRVLAMETQTFGRWARLYAQQNHQQMLSQQLQAKMLTAMSILPAVAMLIVLAGATLDMDVGSMITFQVALTQFVAAVMMLCPALLALFSVLPLYSRLSLLLNAEPEVKPSLRKAHTLSGAIQIHRLSFRYSPASPFVLNDISLTIEPGQFVCFVGASGCGKSTLLRLLLKFETPEHGNIAYDGEDLAQIDVNTLRRQMGVVLQHSQLLPGSIFNNIVGAAPLTMDDAWEAVRLARLEDDIKAMPMGMHSMTGESSGMLSGGQKQRLLMARALVSRPRVLLLDEATSALDNRTQAELISCLESLTITRIMVAHRLSTIRGADQIFVFDQGRIVQQGRFEQLMAVPGTFRDMMERQMLERSV